MADDESFLLVNLKEDKAKELAQVIGNESCRKILDYLTTKKKATESEIAKDLKQPLSTVHYNLQHLYKAGLVVAEEFHYSEKGKEVNHYSLAKKFIIIAPESSPSFMDKLKKILPMAAFAMIAAGALQVFTWLSSHSNGKALMSSNSAKMIADASDAVARSGIQDRAAEASSELMRAAGDGVMAASSYAAPTAGNQTAPLVLEKYVYVVQNVPSEQNIALWFLAGSVAVILFVLIMSLLKRK